MKLLLLPVLVVVGLVLASTGLGDTSQPTEEWPYGPPQLRCLRLVPDAKQKVYLNGKHLRLGLGQIVVTCHVDAPING